MKVLNITRSTILADKVQVAQTFYRRTKGLLGRKSMQEKEALIIKNCKSIHTFFMQFPIDVLFVSKDNKIVTIKKSVPSFRLTPVYLKADFVIELPAKSIEKTQTQLGDSIKIET